MEAMTWAEHRGEQAWRKKQRSVTRIVSISAVVGAVLQVATYLRGASTFHDSVIGLVALGIVLLAVIATNLCYLAFGR